MNATEKLDAYKTWLLILKNEMRAKFMQNSTQCPEDIQSTVESLLEVMNTKTEPGVLEEGEHCTCCGAVGGKANPHRMDKSKVQMLMDIARVNASDEPKRQWAKIISRSGRVPFEDKDRTVHGDQVHGSRLLWFGLVNYREYRSAEYQINENGIKYLQGDLFLPEVIYVRGGVVMSASERLIGVHDVEGVYLDKGYWDHYPDSEVRFSGE